MGLPRRARDPAELRKRLKPLLEKRRRAHINASLSQLKGLILPLLGRESSRYSKLEKADILEMTVRFLQELPASSCPMAAPTPCDSYREGYQACLARLARVLLACRVLEPAVSTRLLEHLRQRAAAATPDGIPIITGDSVPPAPVLPRTSVEEGVESREGSSWECKPALLSCEERVKDAQVTHKPMPSK
ncbi:Transcription factor HES-2 [Camelus dromedarius]|uniref:Transcription factor HES-2 n=1 Tax=Camelus dromedarius TaxID=9838 RepID=A0A5N4DCR5_CAMDR|nr:Transcription factor HES-2 [Camelus dromedarius]